MGSGEQLDATIRPATIVKSNTAAVGVLAPVGNGASKAVTEETAEAAREVIDALGIGAAFLGSHRLRPPSKAVAARHPKDQWRHSMPAPLLRPVRTYASRGTDAGRTQ